MTGTGVSVPIEPSDSTALRAIGAITSLKSSCVKPNIRCCCTAELCCGTRGNCGGRSSRCTCPASSQSWYGSMLASSALISASGMMRPCVVSTRNVRPGSRRPLRTMRSGGTSSTPTSDAMITRSSSVTQ